jgi:ADP-heptose:LPS heptosyltransferase
MHSIVLHEDIEYPGVRLYRNIPYVCESQMVASFAQLTDGNITAEPVSVHKRSNDNPASIMVMRAGGAGDILFLTPTLKALKAKFPDAWITLATCAKYHWITAHEQWVDAYSDFPVKQGILARNDWVLDLENTVEKIVDRHVVDIFAEKCGVVLRDKKCIYRFGLAPHIYVSELVKTKKRIALQWAASSPVRSYPQIKTLFQALLKDGWQVVLYGEPNSISLHGELENVINVTALPWTWEMGMSFLRTCDMVVGPDSSVVHFAGAMDLPTIALYGSFDARFRTAYHPTVEIMQATQGCDMAPCFHHGRRGFQFPPKGPCSTQHFCSSLASLSVPSIIDRIRAKALQLNIT